MIDLGLSVAVGETKFSWGFLALIINATAKRIKTAGIIKIGLTGTSYTMTEKFYIDRLNRHSITTIISDKRDCEKMNQIIYKELIWGNVTPESKSQYSVIIDKLIAHGAKGVILGFEGSCG